jgi:hypothetical protein
MRNRTGPAWLAGPTGGRFLEHSSITHEYRRGQLKQRVPEAVMKESLDKSLNTASGSLTLLLGESDRIVTSRTSKRALDSSRS